MWSAGIQGLSWRTSWCLVAASAALYALSFPPFTIGAFAWVCLVPLIVALSQTTPLRGALLAVGWAALTTLAVTWWLPGTIGRYFEVGPTLSWLGFAVIAVAINGLPYAPFGAFVAWQSRRGRAGPIAVAAAFCLAEFARANGWIAQPFALIGYSQFETTFAQLSALVGPYGVGALIVAANAALAFALLLRRKPRRVRLESVAVAVSAVAAFVYGERVVNEPILMPETVRVAVVQPAIGAATRSDRLSIYLALTRQSAAEHPDLVFWPEHAVDTYLREPSPERDRILGATSEIGADLVLGAPHYRHARFADAENLETRYFTSVFLIREGEIHSRYDKMHLVPFAESAPRLAGFALPAWGEVHYEPGTRPRLLESGRARIGAFLCVEAHFPDVARRLTLGGANLLANPSNDEWFAHPSAARHQLTAASFRAIENRRYLVRAAPGGFSSVIDPYGRAVATSPFGEEALVSSTVGLSNETTPYQRTGDTIVWLALLYLVAGSPLGARGPSWET